MISASGAKAPDMLIPISLENDWPTVDDVVDSILEQHTNYGLTGFMLACPSGGWRSLGYLSKSDFKRLAEAFKAVKARLAGRGFALGWWNTLTIKSGGSADFTPIVKSDGTSHPFASCPLCESFASRFASDIAAFSRIAKPDFIIFEDDFAINSAAGG